MKLSTTLHSALFKLNGISYYLVKFINKPGVDSITHRDAKMALEESGHVPAKIEGDQGGEILIRLYDLKIAGWITLFDCRKDMKDRVGYFVGRSAGTAVHLGLANKNDGLMFYHLDHGASGEHPALCQKEVGQ